MKKLTCEQSPEKLTLNNSGTVELSRLIPLNKIKLRPEFQNLFPLNPVLLQKITLSIKNVGYDQSQPLHIWVVDGVYCLIDGHHRYQASRNNGLHEAPCFLHYFGSIAAALEYATKLQTDRRNLSDGELLTAQKTLDKLKLRGKASDGQGKSAAKTAALLGTSISKVEKARFINAHGSAEIKAAVAAGTITLNQAYEKVKENMGKRSSKTPCTKKSIDYTTGYGTAMLAALSCSNTSAMVTELKKTLGPDDIRRIKNHDTRDRLMLYFNEPKE